VEEEASGVLHGPREERTQGCLRQVLRGMGDGSVMTPALTSAAWVVADSLARPGAERLWGAARAAPSSKTHTADSGERR
jgi:hypothetical protein